jgi:hypothetical protein
MRCDVVRCSGSADDWSFWTGYFDAAFKLITGESKEKEEEKDKSAELPTLQSLRAFIASLQAAELKRNAPVRRGPFLAECELERRALLLSMCCVVFCCVLLCCAVLYCVALPHTHCVTSATAELESSTDHLLQLLIAYFRRFSAKPMLFWDLQSCLDVLCAQAPAQALTLATTLSTLPLQLEPDTNKVCFFVVFVGVC